MKKSKLEIENLQKEIEELKIRQEAIYKLKQAEMYRQVSVFGIWEEWEWWRILLAHNKRFANN